MKIEFDPIKDKANHAKHGVSLALAAQLDWASALAWVDARKDYGEARQCALGLVGERVYFVAFVDRAQVRRVISVRKANSREELHYARFFDAS